ncbi:hypothetical protein MHYP_G00085680 [Metynnis hypsauchen]
MEVLIISEEATSPKQTVYIQCPLCLTPTTMKMQVMLVLVGVFLPEAVLGDGSMTLSGCASKSFCDKTPFLLSSVLRTNFTDLTCCQGNLCNSAGDVMRSLLTMQLFLLSSIFFL